MTVMEEHERKVDFINGMEDKYNYRLFESFCSENDFEQMGFFAYAGYVVSLESPTKSNNENVKYPQPCGTCGGGKVL